MAKGKLQICQPNQEACQNELRRDSQGIRVTKRCKQARACESNFEQNPIGAWFPKQCNDDAASSVCRCCCNFDACNANFLGCQEDDQYLRLRDSFSIVLRGTGKSCPIPRTPRFGSKVCNRRSRRVPTGTKCSFRCNNGYRLIGASKSICDKGQRSKEARFTRSPPTCRPLTCRSRQTAPKHGSLKCSRSIRIWSICTFQCDAGYVLRGRKSSQCQPSGSWSNLAPTCVPYKCLRMDPPRNGMMTCTNDNNMGSSCTFECTSGFSLMGRPQTRCYNRNGRTRWTKSPPTCSEIQCPKQIAPTNGMFECIGGSRVGSVCSFVCKEGYYLDGNVDVRCMDDFNGDSVGMWSSPAPSCRGLSCPPNHTNLRDGSIRCEEDSLDGIYCTFQCDEGFRIHGEPTSSCSSVDGSHIGAWSSSTPDCRPIQCVWLPSSPANGSMKCNNANHLESQCVFECEEGLTLIGEKMAVCMTNNDGDVIWSSKPPTCENYIPVSCSEYKNPKHGTIYCSDANREDSVCIFDCDQGYDLIGMSFSMCERKESGKQDFIGQWTSSTPNCTSKKCGPAPPARANGVVVCSNGGSPGSICKYTCLPSYFTSGKSELECIERDNELIWSGTSPKCVVSECASVEPVNNGQLSCSRGNRIDSVCSYTCDEHAGYRLHPSNATQRVCMSNGEWSATVPCCVRDCPTYSATDLVLVVHTSSAAGRRNQKRIKKFIGSFIDSFIISPELTQVAVVPFNNKVDLKSQILLNEYENNIELSDAFNNVSYNGKGTNTGQALNHVADVILKRGNGNRPDAKDVVIVLTDGTSTDDVTLPSKRLRSRGVLVYAVGMETDGVRLDREQLLLIAGRKENLQVEGDDFEKLQNSLLERLERALCRKECEGASDRLSIPEPKEERQQKVDPILQRILLPRRRGIGALRFMRLNLV